MTNFFKTIIVLLCVCVCLGKWQYNNIRFVAREYYSLNHHFSRNGVLIDNIMTKRMVRQDRESAAVLRFCLSDFSFIGSLDAISKYRAEFPENQFFMLVFASRTLSGYDGFDPEIPSKIADKLLSIDPHNAYYHYLKAYTLFRLRSGTDLEPTLNHLEQGNNSPKLIDPYQHYRDGVIRLANAAALEKSFIESHLQNQTYYTAMFLRDLRENLASLSFRAVINNDTALAFRINDAIRIFDSKLKHSPSSPFQPFMFPDHLGNIDWMELHNLLLPKERSLRNRQNICQMILRTWHQQDPQPSPAKDHHSNAFHVLSLAPGVSAAQVFAGFACLALILLTVSLKFGAGPVYKFKLGTVLLFITMMPLIMFASILIANALHRTELSCCYSYLTAFGPAEIKFGHMDKMEIIGWILFLISPLLILGLLWLCYFSKPRPGAFWKYWYFRIGASALLALAAALIDHVLTPYPEGKSFLPFIIVSGISFVILVFLAFLGSWLFTSRIIWLASFLTFFLFVSKAFGVSMALTVLFAACFALAAVAIVLSNHQISKLRVIKDIFSSKSSFRRPALALALLGMCFAWICFVSLVPAMSQSIKAGIESRGHAPHHPVTVVPADPYKAVYDRLKNDPNIDILKFPACGILTPDDLQTALPELLKRKYNTFGAFGPMGGPGIFFGYSGQKDTTPSSFDIFNVIERAPRDTAPLFTAGFQNPDSNLAVVARALARDKTACDSLVKIFQQQVISLRSYNPWAPQPEPLNEPNLYTPGLPHTTKALILACPPDFACELLVDVIRNEPVNTIGNCQIGENLPYLPNPCYSRAMSTLYDRMIDSNSHDQSNLFSNLWRKMQMDSSSTNALKAVRLIIKRYADQNELDYFGIEPYLTEAAVPILVDGLSKKNPKLRAWCLWQVRRLAPNSNVDIQKFLSDSEPSVRANSVLFGKASSRIHTDSVCDIIQKLIAE